jgi:hypothetical protein
LGRTGVPSPCEKPAHFEWGSPRHMSPASSGWVVPFPRQRSGSQAASGDGSVMRQTSGTDPPNQPRSRVMPPVPWFRNPGRTQSVMHDRSVATVSQCGGPSSGGFERTKPAAETVRCRNRNVEKGSGPPRIEHSAKEGAGQTGDDHGGAIRSEARKAAQQGVGRMRTKNVT